MAKNKNSLNQILKEERMNQNNLTHIRLAKERIIDRMVYLKMMTNHKCLSPYSKKSLEVYNSRKKIEKLSDKIKKFEDSVLKISDIKHLCLKHKIPPEIISRFRDYIIYDKVLLMPPSIFEFHNISIKKDETTDLKYIELKIFGNTSRQEIIDNWPLIQEIQKDLPDYKNPKSKPRSKIYNELAMSKPREEIADDELSNGDPLAKHDIKKFKKKMNTLRTIQTRRKKTYNL